MRKNIFCTIILTVIAAWFNTAVYAANANTIILLEVKGAIGPAVQDYVQRGLADARAKHANLVILELDTPGGLETAMRNINQAILASTVPVASYVAPAGARAASAGTFILYASHIAAMAPGTHLGAASPVNIGNMPGTADEKNSKNAQTAQKKAMNDAIAYIRSLAELRHRNVAWAESAVKEAVSLPAVDALRMNVIDLMAGSVPDLIKKLNGRSVIVEKAAQVLQTRGASVQTIKPDWRFEFLATITHPTVAYILLLIGIYGIFFEFANPGFILPGLVGTISLLLALYALQLLPINYVGLALLVLGVACMITEVLITSFGLIGISGIVAFIAGSIMLFDTHLPGYSIAASTIVIMCSISVIFFFVVFSLTVGSLRKPIVTGREALIGAEGEVVEHRGHYFLVRVQGEIWSAQCDAPLRPGQKIRVKKISNLILFVVPM